MNEPIFIRRPNFFPKKSSDLPFFSFISVMIPITYYFEVWVVLPSLFADYPYIYWTLFICGHFVLHNVVGNFLGILMCDSSIMGRKMPSEEEPRVQFCVICDTYTPPRSYHCPSCDTCILKRDHHCIFTGCCVGFYNHRFFIFFVFYLMLSTVVCLPFNVYFLWGVVSLSELAFLVMVFFPVLVFLIEGGSTYLESLHLYVIISVLGIVGSIICSVWFYFHMKLILQGTIVQEMKKCINIYNFGQKKNVQLVFGTKWYLTWISPYIKSPLICDGIRYPVKD